MGHHLSKLARKNRQKCEFCSLSRPPSYKETPSYKEVEKDEKPPVNQVIYPTDSILEIHPDACLLFDSLVRRNQIAIDDLESARRLIIALQNKDVKAFLEVLESTSSIQDTKGITAVTVDVRSREIKQNHELLICLEFVDGQHKVMVLTRCEPDPAASFGGIHWWGSGCHCTQCCPFM